MPTNEQQKYRGGRNDTKEEKKFIRPIAIKTTPIITMTGPIILRIDYIVS